MSDELPDIQDINETDPVRAVLAIDKHLRPSFDQVTNSGQVEIIYAYRAMMERACALFGVDFNIDEPSDDSTPTAKKVLYLTKLEIDKLKINLLHEKIQAGDSVALDDPWREKIHSYIAIIRQLVEGASLPVEIRDSIMAKLHSLSSEIDRRRTRIQVFTQVLVGLCEGVSAGAEALTPAVRLVERVIGAIARLHSAPPMLSLPPPDGCGLPPPDTVPELAPPETREA